MIISIVNNKSVTEDLMQDTYIKMIEKIHYYEKGRNFYAWLLQIAKNTALDHYRKHKREVVYDPHEKDYVFEQPVKEDQSYMVHDLIKPLDDDEKQIVLLRIVSNNKFKEIARATDKPLGTVLWIYNRAIKKLQDYNKGKE